MGARIPAVDKRLRNPFRSEADAFRLLIIVGLAVLAVVVAAAIGGAWLGVPVAVVLLFLGGRASYRWLRLALSSPEGLGAGGSEGAREPRE